MRSAHTWSDVRRRIARGPGSVTFAVVTLALSVGVTTAAISVAVRAFRPAAIHDIAQVVNVKHVRPPGSALSLFEADYVRTHQRTFSRFSTWAPVWMTLAVSGRSEQTMVELVDGHYFELVGVPAAAGRVIQPADDAPANAAVGLIAETAWRRYFGSDPHILGRLVTVNDVVVEIVGVVPASFGGVAMPNVAPTQIWLPLAIAGRFVSGWATGDQQTGTVQAKGRLKPGTTMTDAAADMARLAGLLDAMDPPSNRPGAEFFERRRLFTVRPAASVRMFETIDATALPFRGAAVTAVTLVLLMAASNLALFTVARRTSRRRESAVRLALGATPGSLARTDLAEGLVIATAGGIAGLGVARIVMVYLDQALARWLSQPEWVLAATGLDAAALFVCVLSTSVAFLVFCVLPALLQRDFDLRGVLARSDATATVRWRGRGLLIAGQVATSVVLLGVATLCASELVRAASRPTGIDVDRLAILQFCPGCQNYDARRAARELELAAVDIAQAPGVAGVALSTGLPFGRTFTSRATVRIPSETSQPAWVALLASNVDLLPILGIRLMSGRELATAHTGQPEIILSQKVARQLFHDVTPLGQVVEFRRQQWVGEQASLPQLRVVVGVADDTDVSIPGQRTIGSVYVPLAGNAGPALNLIIRAHGALHPVVDLGRRTVQRSVPRLAIVDAGTGPAITGTENLALRSSAFIGGVLGAGMLLLSVIGLAGVLVHVTMHRKREMAVRMTLGATQGRIVRSIVADGLRPVAAGLGIGTGVGLIAQAASQPLLSRFLPAVDWLVLAPLPFVFLLVASLAAYWPARRTARVSPMAVLKGD